MTAQEIINKLGAGGPADSFSERSGELEKWTLTTLFNEMSAWLALPNVFVSTIHRLGGGNG
jgi:hypothetical protein